MRVPLSLGFLLLVSCSVPPGFSQSTAAPAVTTPGDGRVAEWMYGEHIPRVPALPFSAKVELELVNQLQDGTLITHKTYNLDARNSQGRTRNEARNWINPALGAEPRLIRIELYDPATRTRINVFPSPKRPGNGLSAQPFPPPRQVRPRNRKQPLRISAPIPSRVFPFVAYALAKPTLRERSATIVLLSSSRNPGIPEISKSIC
jgi:hypothetical protein